ncbi:MAG: peptide ABC transporter permease [Elusimicrobia bacterium RIFOXYA2_FULL_39_19]|nr:MAG: peptide ABC transporter permease [Elusimicrobia bacterium RIFOXYA2_FULL_39_19]
MFSELSKRLKKDKIARISLAIIILYFAVALFTQAGLLLPDFDKVNYTESYQPPSASHICGTDYLGRDVFSRILHGTRVAISVGIVSSFIAIPIGVLLGCISGFFGGKIDEFVVWLYTTLDSVPGLLLIMALSLVLGRGLYAVYLALGLTTWVSLCRLIRSEFIKHREREYVLAAKALGAGSLRQIFIHILPNVFHIVIINFSLRFVYAIQSEVILSYLGLGAQDMPSWGIMINDAKVELARGVWWQLTGATGAMFLLILAFNIFGDFLRDTLDPKLRGVE